MQYRLSTIFLIFFVVASTLSLFGTVGLWLSPIILFLALLINKVRSITLVELLVIIAVIGILIGLLIPARSESHEKHRIRKCVDNLKNIGRALQSYVDEHGHFPAATVRNEKGQALHSWRVEILPQLGYGEIYKQLRQDEFWDSPHNLEILNSKNPNSQILISEYSCPSNGNNDYAAIIGPGTAWREGKITQLSDLPDGGKHTVMVLEMLGNNKNWAEPDSLAVDELIKQFKTAQGTNGLSNHPGLFHVLLADGSVWRIPSSISISEFEKLLSGEVKSIDELKKGLDKDSADWAAVCYNASESHSLFSLESQPSPTIYALPFWLLSVILLFRRAVKSRKKENDREKV